MILKCNSNKLGHELRDILKTQDWFEGSFDHITVGEKYIALGLKIPSFGSSGQASCGAYILDDDRQCSMVPLCLFDIVDGTLSSHWIAGRTGPDEFKLCPASFFQEYYHDDLSEGDPEIVADFEVVCRKLYEESKQNISAHNTN